MAKQSETLQAKQLFIHPDVVKELRKQAFNAEMSTAAYMVHILTVQSGVKLKEATPCN